MNLKDLLKLSHQIMKDSGIDHALIGGIALGARGVQRFTNDIDFLVKADDRLALKSSFLKRGFSVYFESAEVMQFEGVGHVDFLFAQRALSLEMLAKAPLLPDFEIKCASVESLIGLKIQAYKNNPKREFQDKADIQALIAQNPTINWKDVKIYANIFDEWAVLCEIRDKTEVKT